MSVRVASASNRDATDTAIELARGDYTSAELTTNVLGDIERCNPRLHAYTHVLTDQALDAARSSDARRARGRSLGPLDGLPVSIKANIAVCGAPHHAGQRFRESHAVRADAPVTARLRAAGAVIVGITNMDEGALGARGRNPWYQDVVNPLSAALSVGGSSAGAACALAAHLCTLAIGTDTIGSVRIPAAYCGLAALKPTFAAVSTRDVVPVHHRFDHVGAIARSTRDLATTLAVVAGWDAQWRLSFPVALRAADQTLPKLRIGFLVGFDEFGVSADVIEGYNAAVAALRGLGHALTHVDAGSWQLASAYRATFALCEVEMARAHRERLLAQPHDYSPSLRALLEFGARQTGEQLAAYESRLAALQARLLAVFREIDVLITPTVPAVALAADASEPTHSAVFTNLASASGRPAVALPLRPTRSSPPPSLQLIGAPGSDYELLRLAQSLEAAMS